MDKNRKATLTVERYNGRTASRSSAFQPFSFVTEKCPVTQLVAVEMSIQALPCAFDGPPPSFCSSLALP